MTKRQEKIWELVRLLYKSEDGKPLELTPSQVEIFDTIYGKRHPRVEIMAHTRFGKSMTVGLAVLTRIALVPEKWAIVAPSEKKAKIIMGVIIDHTFDNEITKRKLMIEKGETLEHLRRERSKSRLTYKHDDGTYGEVYIISADQRNRSGAGDTLMGFGAPNVVLDEGALIDDDIEAKIFRMLGDKVDNYYFKIGNPFRRGHFYKSWMNPKYFKINVDYNKGIEEGRLKRDFIEEARLKPYFSVLYENNFPEEDELDEKGWTSLITETEFNYAQDEIARESWFGDKVMGVDVARGGGNFNVWVLRCGNYAKILEKTKENDLMAVVGNTIRLAKEQGIDYRNIFVDDTGVGAGVFDRLSEQRMQVNRVTLGGTADEDAKFINRRAENYWRLKEWINRGGKVDKSEDWTELLSMKYKSDSQGRLKMMSKDEMRKNGVDSPDVADALMLTFDFPAYNRLADEMAQESEKVFDKYSLI